MNSLNQELSGRVVIFDQKMFNKHMSLKERAVVIDSGFGSHSFTIGTGVFGKWVSNGELTGKLNSMLIECFATAEELNEWGIAVDTAEVIK